MVYKALLDPATTYLSSFISFICFHVLSGVLCSSLTDLLLAPEIQNSPEVLRPLPFFVHSSENALFCALVPLLCPLSRSLPRFLASPKECSPQGSFPALPGLQVPFICCHGTLHFHVALKTTALNNQWTWSVSLMPNNIPCLYLTGNSINIC